MVVGTGMVQETLRGFAGIDLSTLSGVLIDLDNTLYAYDPAHRAGLHAACARVAHWGPYEVVSKEYRAARDAVTARLRGQGACRSRLFAFQSLCEGRGEAAPYVLARELDRIYWRSFLDAMRVDGEAMNFLKRCKHLGLPVCVVTDMTAHVQVDKLLALGLSGLIDHLVTSEEVGIEKPDPRMFAAGLAKIGVTAAAAIMIGDDHDKDIKGAEAAGLRAVHYAARA